PNRVNPISSGPSSFAKNAFCEQDGLPGHKRVHARLPTRYARQSRLVVQREWPLGSLVFCHKSRFVRHDAVARSRASRFSIARAATVPLPIAVAMHGCAGLETSPTANTPRQDVSILPSTAR